VAGRPRPVRPRAWAGPTAPGLAKPTDTGPGWPADPRDRPVRPGVWLTARRPPAAAAVGRPGH